MGKEGERKLRRKFFCLPICSSLSALSASVYVFQVRNLLCFSFFPLLLLLASFGRESGRSLIGDRYAQVSSEREEIWPDSRSVWRRRRFYCPPMALPTRSAALNRRSSGLMPLPDTRCSRSDSATSRSVRQRSVVVRCLGDNRSRSGIEIVPPRVCGSETLAA